MKKKPFLPDKTVLIIGAGPSGVDLTFMISEFAKAVIFSHHTHKEHYVYPSNVITKGSIQKFTKNTAIFIDGSVEEITDIIFCTGIYWKLNNISEFQLQLL